MEVQELDVATKNTELNPSKSSLETDMPTMLEACLCPSLPQMATWRILFLFHERLQSCICMLF